MDDHSSTLDAPRINGQADDLDTSSGDRSTNCCRTRYKVWTVLAVLILPLAGWRFNADREYWHQAWKQGSLTPQSSEQDNLGRPADSATQLTAFQRGPAFDLSTTVVPVGEIGSGGPPKDGIPALTNPKFVTARQANYLQPQDRVIGVVVDGEARAYPLKILDYHEIVNDRIGKLPVAVTYCPLCDSCAVFDRRTPLGEREFGVSGLLYNSNVLMYDRGGKPESLWSQVMTKGVSGPAARKSLTALPLELTAWQDWQARHPETKVLSNQTGHARNYNRSPYGGYFETPQLMFPAKPASDRLPTKARVLGVWTDTAARAYPESMFSRNRTRIEEKLDGKKIVIEFNPAAKSLRVIEADEGVHWMYSLWFAWYAMRPDTEVFSR